MKAILWLTLSLLLLESGELAVMAQDFPSVLRKIEDAVKAKEPDWKLVMKDSSKGQATFQWEWETESKKQGVRVRLVYAASRKEASEHMKIEMNFVPVSPDRKLQDLGDEAYLWISPHHKSGAIQFRKSNMYINISAPSDAIAESLARQIANLIPNK